MSRFTVCVFVLAVVLAVGLADPIPLSDRLPLATASDLSMRLAAHAQHLQAEQRLPVPTLQDIEAIKKVAQILITLGQQVIPAIIGEPSAPTPINVNCDPEDATEDNP